MRIIDIDPCAPSPCGAPSADPGASIDHTRRGAPSADPGASIDHTRQVPADSPPLVAAVWRARRRVVTCIDCDGQGCDTCRLWGPS